MNQKFYLLFDFNRMNRGILISIIFLEILLIQTLYRINMVQLDTNQNIRKWNIQLYWESLLKIGTISFFGIIINHTSLKHNSSLFTLIYLGLFLVLGVIVISCLLDYSTYSQSNAKILKNTKDYIKIWVLIELLFLCAIGKSNVLVIVIIYGLYLVIELGFESVINICKKQIEEENERESMEDIPIDSMKFLFPSRRKQLNLLNEIFLKKEDQEAFAIMISGDWGYGKTSFIKVFQTENKKDEFIFVKGGFEFSIERFLDDICLQFEKIFEKNNFYTDKNSQIKKYFKNLIALIGESGSKVPSALVHSLFDENTVGYYESKELINQELNNFYKVTEKRIFIIIDDLDRCKDEFKEKMFGVIRESVELNNCITIFLADNVKFQTNHMNSTYLEKYINKRIELMPIEFEEILEQYADQIFDDEFRKDKSIYFSEKLINIKNDILEKVENIKNKIQIESENINNEINRLIGKNESETYDHQLEKMRIEFDGFQRSSKSIEQGLRNPRKVKRFLNEIKRVINLVDILWFSEENYGDNVYSKENWIDIIMDISFIKIFLEDDYMKMQEYKRIQEYQKSQDRKYIEIILGTLKEELWREYNENEVGVINLIIYQLFTMDCNINKTALQKLIDEIDRNQMCESHLEKYISQCLGSNVNEKRLEQVIDFLKKEVTNPSIKARSILSVCNLLLQSHVSKDIKYKTAIKKINELYNEGILEGIFSVKELEDLEEFKMDFQKYWLSGNIFTFRNILQLQYPSHFIYEKVKSPLNVGSEKGISTVDKLYEVLKEINIEEDKTNYAFCGKNKIKEIQGYFERVYLRFNDEKYNDIKEEINKYIEQCDYVLSTIAMWYEDDEIDKSEIAKKNKMEAELRKYLNYDASKYNQIIDDKVEALIKDIKNMEDSLCINQKVVNKDFFQAFLNICIFMAENLISKNNVKWYQNKESKMIKDLYDLNKKFSEIYEEAKEKYNSEQSSLRESMNTRIAENKIVLFILKKDFVLMEHE